MNTPAHLIFGATLFAKPDQKYTAIAAMAGSLMPDLSLYLMAGWSLFILNNPADYVFGTQYFSDTWQSVFAVDNSFVVWGILLALAIWLTKPWAIAFTGSGLLHIAFDFPLHHDDGRAHFWPFSDWIFQSPISYWDNNHFGHIIAPIEAIAVAICAVILWRRFSGHFWRWIFIAIAALQIVPSLAFAFMFS